MRVIPSEFTHHLIKVEVNKFIKRFSILSNDPFLNNISVSILNGKDFHELVDFGLSVHVNIISNNFWSFFWVFILNEDRVGALDVGFFFGKIFLFNLFLCNLFINRFIIIKVFTFESFSNIFFFSLLSRLSKNNLGQDIFSVEFLDEFLEVSGFLSFEPGHDTFRKFFWNFKESHELFRDSFKVFDFLFRLTVFHVFLPHVKHTFHWIVFWHVFHEVIHHWFHVLHHRFHVLHHVFHHWAT